MIKALIVLWKRPEITRICFDGVKRLEKFGVEPICIYSDNENKELVEEYGFEGYYHKNLPLGKKFNFGIKKALESEWEYLMQIGSDDLISDKLFEIYKPYFERKEKAFGITKVYCVDVKTGNVGYSESGYPFGAGRMLHRSCFDVGVRYRVKFLQSAAGKDFSFGKGREIEMSRDAALRFERHGLVKIIGTVEDSRELWTNDKNRSLDFDSDFTLKTKGIDVVRVPTDECLVLDLKSEVNIWPFSFYKPTNEDVISKFPERDAIRKLR